jgi:RHS repeat-associated protein
VKRWYDGSTGYYIYDGEKPILEYSVSGQIYGRNVYGKGIDEILMRTDYTLSPAVPYYHQQDHEGSVTHLTDGSGNVIEKYRYDAFGAPVYYDGSGVQIGGSSYDNRFLFTGREFLGAWYEYRARTYHPLLGRFMSEDPKLFDAGDYNLYRYCHNDPEDMTDPMGLAVELYVKPPYIGFSPMEGDAARIGAYNAAAQKAFQQLAKQNATMGQTQSSQAQGGKIPTRASVALDHTFELSSWQLYYGGRKANALTVRHLEDAQAVEKNGVIYYSQRVVAKTTFKTGISLERVLGEWKRVESLQHEVNALNSLVHTEARAGFPNAEAAKAHIGAAVQADWKQFLFDDSIHFELFGGGRPK